MKISTNKEKIEEILTRGVENVYPNREYLKAQLVSGKKLRLYLGIDPTGPHLHLGHAIQLMKLQQFQALGHEVILLIGDFTGMIGDPTDKSAVRKKLTRDQVMKNAKNYREQASSVIDVKKLQFKYNSKWLAAMSFSDVIELASNMTVQRMLERDMFANRMKEGKPIYLHEFMYPLMQGYDSVAMDVDGEVGGNDQTFNMLVGRDLMKFLSNKDKFVITSKLLADPTGKKMGKTEGNMITLSDAPEDMFGKVMSWSDEMIIPSFELITRLPMDTIKKYDDALVAGENPRDIKMALAHEVVKTFVGIVEADAAKQHFITVFSNKEKPTNIPEHSVAGQNVVDALISAALVKSKSEARRVLAQNGVKVNDEVITDQEHVLAVGDVLQKGKRFFIKVI